MRQRRLLMAAEARALGHGGIRVVARAAGVREATVSLGVDELDSGAEPLGRARRPGGGRKRAAAAVDGEVDPQPADELTRQGHKLSADTAPSISTSTTGTPWARQWLAVHRSLCM